MRHVLHPTCWCLQRDLCNTWPNSGEHDTMSTFGACPKQDSSGSSSGTQETILDIPRLIQSLNVSTCFLKLFGFPFLSFKSSTTCWSLVSEAVSMLNQVQRNCPASMLKLSVPQWKLFKGRARLFDQSFHFLRPQVFWQNQVSLLRICEDFNFWCFSLWHGLSLGWHQCLDPLLALDHCRLLSFIHRSSTTKVTQGRTECFISVTWSDITFRASFGQDIQSLLPRTSIWSAITPVLNATFSAKVSTETSRPWKGHFMWEAPKAPKKPLGWSRQVDVTIH